MEQLFGYEQVAKWIVNIRLTFVLFALVSGSVVFAGHRGFFVGGIEGAPEEGGIGLWGCSRGCCWDFVRRMYRGTLEEGGIAPGVDAVGDVFEVLRGGCG